jgi:hypothetical protein
MTSSFGLCYVRDGRNWQACEDSQLGDIIAQRIDEYLAAKNKISNNGVSGDLSTVRFLMGDACQFAINI